MNKESTTQPVVIRNRFAMAEYKTMEEAASSLSQIGVMSRDEVLKLLRDHAGYINGFVVTYPERHQ